MHGSQPGLRKIINDEAVQKVAKVVISGDETSSSYVFLFFFFFFRIMIKHKFVSARFFLFLQNIPSNWLDVFISVITNIAIYILSVVDCSAS